MVYQASSVGSFERDFALRDQIRRAAISIGSNIAEGFERGGNGEFRQFLYIAKGSCGEVRSQVYTSLDAGHVTEDEFEALRTECLHVSRLIAGIIRYLKETELRGPKYIREPEADYDPDTLSTPTSGL